MPTIYDPFLKKRKKHNIDKLELLCNVNKHFFKKKTIFL